MDKTTTIDQKWLISKRKDLIKIPEMIFHIKSIPSHMMRM